MKTMTSLLNSYLGKICLLLISLCPITELRADWKIYRKNPPEEIEQLASQSGKTYMIEWLEPATKVCYFFAYRKELQYYRDYDPDYMQHEHHEPLTRVFDWKSAHETLRTILQRHLGAHLLHIEQEGGPYIGITILADLEGKMFGVILDLWAYRGDISADTFEAIEHDILTSDIKLGYRYQGLKKFFGQSSWGDFNFIIETDSIIEELEKLGGGNMPPTKSVKKAATVRQTGWRMPLLLMAKPTNHLDALELTLL